MLPAVLLTLIVAGSVLPAHGVTRLVDVVAATVAALGLVAISLAAPQWARAVVLDRAQRLGLIGSSPEAQPEAGASARRRMAAVLVGAVVSATAVLIAAAPLPLSGSTAAGHAVLLVTLYANAAVLLSNVVPLPPWPGWSLLLAVLDLRAPTGAPTLDRAVPIARWILVAQGATVAAVALVIRDWTLLLLAALLVWQGWIATTIAKADAHIGRYLAARCVGDLSREFSTLADPDEAARIAIARRPTETSVIAVRDGGAVLGVIGPRQAAALPPSAGGMRCGELMVPLEDLDLLRPESPAVAALAQLDRFGFALVRERGDLRYVEASDVLQRILLTAAVARAVSADGDVATSRASRQESR